MSISFILQQTILYTIPILLVALGGIFAERSGIINLALEGEMIFGAFIGAIICKVFISSGVFQANSQLLFIIGMLVSSVAGVLLSLLLSFASIKLKADQTVVGTALNLLAPAIVCTFGLLFFNQEKVVSGASFVLTADSYSNPSFVQGVKDNSILNFFFDKVYISTYIGILVYILLAVWLYKSKVGTHIRACGEHPQAADTVGINVSKMRFLGTSISGALAGLGGFIYIATRTATTADSGVGGLGFLALAIMIFGNWNPFFVALGSLFFGFLTCVGVLNNQIPFLADLGLSMYFYNMVPYIMVIIVLILTHKKSGCPKAEGIPYDKGQR